MSAIPAAFSGRAKVVWLTVYYMAVLVAVIVLHAQGSFTAPPFVYQGF